MNWILVPQAVTNGVLQGGILALIALGIVLIYKSSEVFNFAQGHMVMIGAYLTWFFAQLVNQADANDQISSQVTLLIAAIGAIVCAVAIGYLIERLTLRPMTGQPLLSIILITLGLSQLFQGATTVIFGTEPLSDFPTLFDPGNPDNKFTFPNPLAPEDALPLFQEVQVPYSRLVAFVIALLIAGGLIAIFQYTRMGLSMRATSEDHELAQSVGIRVSNVFGLTWILAGIIATIGGVLLATLSGVSLNISTIAFVAFPAILLGGLESLGGAILGGILVGIVQQTVGASTVDAIRNSGPIAPYVLLLIVLVIRPEGLFGLKRIERI